MDMSKKDLNKCAIKEMHKVLATTARRYLEKMRRATKKEMNETVQLKRSDEIEHIIIEEVIYEVRYLKNGTSLGSNSVLNELLMTEE